ncbi:MAG TPA: polyprenyl synthetase family protein [Oligoflexia bacterium]|nr:polyprenyl synthetase family protein [Oligoflexia bacterium]HMP47360.1 polyprenyl synthetase family protein [Oligoflexia bacterium]
MNEESTSALKTAPGSILKQDRLGLLKLSVKAAFMAGAPGLRQIENRIRETLASEAQVLTDISTYLLDMGGKRMRPLLTILAAQLFGMKEPSKSLVDAAAGIELIHMATLLHDDIIDQSPLRRSKPSAYSQYGLTATLLTGDFLLVRAFGICAMLDDFVIKETEKACISLTEGEVTEGIIDLAKVPPLEVYIDVVEKKTASLFALASVVGAYLAGADESEISKLRVFGRYAGIAFQMIDDILDITADEDLLGKPAGTDIRQKTPSLVNLIWLQEEPKMASDFFSREQSEEEIKKVLAYLSRSPVIEKARLQAKDFAGRATNALLSLEDGSLDVKVRSQLFSLLDYTLERCL